MHTTIESRSDDCVACITGVPEEEIESTRNTRDRG